MENWPFWAPVVVDERGVSRVGGSLPEVLRWADLWRIAIMTNDEGPWSEDVFWLFVACDGTGCAVPGFAVGRTLFEQLGRLSGVAYERIIEAMGCTENATVEVWRRRAPERAPR